MEQSIIDVLQAQSVRLASVESELQAARWFMPDERKLIERAKGVLMARLGFRGKGLQRPCAMPDEPEPRIADVAEATLALPISSARAASRAPRATTTCCICTIPEHAGALPPGEMPHITA